MNKKIIIIVGTLLIVALVYFLGTFFYTKSEYDERAEWVDKNQHRLQRPHSIVLGPEAAPVTIVEWIDPECESCKAFYPMVKKVMKKYQGQVKLVIRYMPYHQNSFFAISVLESSRLQGKYWEVLEILFKNQEEWGSHHNPKPSQIWAYLPQIEGLSLDKVVQHFNDNKWREWVQQDVDDGKYLKVKKTPAFFINGKPLKTYSLEGLDHQVKSELP